MKPLILTLVSLFSFSALAEVEALDFDVNNFGQVCQVELQTRDGALIQSFQGRSCEEGLGQCEYYLDQLHQQGQNPFATCGVVEDQYSAYPRPYPPPYPPPPYPSDPYRPPRHHRPPPPYNPPRPPPYNPPYPPPYNPPRPPPPYNPPYPPPYNPPRPPPYREESWVCRANDRGTEEHYGGHEGYGRSQAEAADNAMNICLLAHGRCYVTGCQPSYR